jgi:hypothetical protein
VTTPYSLSPPTQKIRKRSLDGFASCHKRLAWIDQRCRHQSL